MRPFQRRLVPIWACWGSREHPLGAQSPPRNPASALDSNWGVTNNAFPVFYYMQERFSRTPLVLAPADEA